MKVTTIFIVAALLAASMTATGLNTDQPEDHNPDEAIHAQWIWYTDQGPVYQFHEVVHVVTDYGCFPGHGCGIPIEIRVNGIIGDAFCLQEEPGLWEGNVRVQDVIRPCTLGDARDTPWPHTSSPICVAWAKVAGPGVGTGFGGQGSGIKQC